MGPFFKNVQVFAMRTPENCEKWAYILRKIPRNGCLFLPKWPFNMGMGFGAQWQIAVQIKSEYPPGVLVCENCHVWSMIV